MAALVSRISRLIFGDAVDPEVRPLVLVTVVMSVARSALWTFLIVWAITELDAKSSLPFVMLGGAVLSAGSGYLGGWLSDHVGRRRVILVAEAAMVVYPVALLAASREHRVALAVLALGGSIGALGGSVSQAMVADLVPPERQPDAYAAVRVAANFGVIFGPPIGSLIQAVSGWTGLFTGVAISSALAWVLAYRLLPAGGRYAAAEKPPAGALAIIARDHAFTLFMTSAVFSWVVYVAWEVVLPVSLVDGYGYETWAWGLIVWVNPFLVTLFQVRLTAQSTRFAPERVLVFAMLLMGLPFLLLTAAHSVPVVFVVAALFVAGEMLWVPTSQTIVARLAPEELRGAYFGAIGSSAAIGWALAPLVGLQTRNSFGDDVTWALFSAVGVVAAVIAVAALSLGRRHTVSVVGVGEA
ncbi:MAG: MFS transporter [Gaiellales bacterium]